MNLASLGRKAGHGALALVLFVLGFCSLLPAAPPRAMWLDETYGLITSMRDVSWAELWWQGAPGQGSPHPLYYLWEKFLFQLAGPAPQRFWNLSLYFRLTPIFFYALTGALVFQGSRPTLRRFLPEAAPWLVTLIAFAFGFFFLKVQFAEYYALEARPYSMWLFLSTAHLLFTIYCLPDGLPSNRMRFAYAVLSALLSAVASPGIFQVGLSFAALAFPRRLWRDGYTLLPAVIVAGLYVRTVGHSGYEIGDFYYYLGCLREVAFKSFHARNGWVFYPLFFLGTAGVARLPRPDCRGRLGGYLAGLLFLTLFLYAMCRWKGFFLASRQYIYLIPAFLLLYFCALWLAAGGLARLRVFGRSRPASFWLGVWAFFLVAQNFPEYALRAVRAPAALARLHAFGANEKAICARPMTDFSSRQEQFAELDRECHPAEAEKH